MPPDRGADGRTSPHPAVDSSLRPADPSLRLVADSRNGDNIET